MPIQYEAGVLTEHNWTRERTGLFDVSHMGQIIVEGVKPGVTTIDRVELTAPDRGFVTDKVTFTNVKVASKK